MNDLWANVIFMNIFINTWYIVLMKVLISTEMLFKRLLTHLGRVMHICISKLTIIGSDNGLSPGRRQAIIWTNARLLLIGP